jgi:hypothetical protein
MGAGALRERRYERIAVPRLRRPGDVPAPAQSTEEQEHGRLDRSLLILVASGNAVPFVLLYIAVLAGSLVLLDAE